MAARALAARGAPVAGDRRPRRPCVAQRPRGDAAQPDAGTGRPRDGELLVESLWRRLRERSAGYLAGLHPTAGLFATLYRALDDLRLSGLTPETLEPDRFEVREKATDLARLLAEYVAALEAENAVDYAEALRMAVRRVREEGPPGGEEALFLVPAEEDRAALERALLQALPADRVIDLPAEPLCAWPEPPAGRTDALRLRWLPDPPAAPPPVGDGTVRIFRAVGPMNEVAKVFRSCLRDGVPLDEVEVLHTDAATYVPLFFEAAERLRAERGIPADAPLVTFAEGVPVRYARPGRALGGWLTWVREDFPQPALVRMLQDGLLNVPAAEDGDPRLAELASLLRPLPIGFGRRRYLEMLDRELNSLAWRVERARRGDEEGEVDEQRLADLARREPELKRLRDLVEALLETTPERFPASPRSLLEGAKGFLVTHARCANEFDHLARDRLVKRIEEVLGLLDGDVALSFDAIEWLAALQRDLTVGGLGPRPGALHLASVRSGGHSGRAHTFLIGLDDSRFPGAGLQDPVLLDTERQALSEALPTASGRLIRRLTRFARILAGLRGRITLGFSCRDVVEDREMFPSPVVLEAYRILSGNPEADQGTLTSALPPPCSFAPREEAECLDTGEWWLHRLSSGPPVAVADAVVARAFPHLERGRAAAAARAGSAFTEYDGHVPEAGRDHDPGAPKGPVMSAHRFETLGRCPLAYFFARVLHIEPPDEFRTDPEAWLPPAERGVLLHDVFRRLIERAVREGRGPEYDRDREEAMRLLERHVARYRETYPVPSESVFDREMRALRRSVEIFLRDEEVFCRTHRPEFLEVGLGLPAEEGRTTPLDTAEPLRLRLPGGMRIRVRGRVDRIDRLPEADGQAFFIWDYKTGSAYRFQRLASSDPFDQGRIVQHGLYLALVEPRLRERLSDEARVVGFGYFFPSERGRAERIEFTSGQLAGGWQIVEQLCRIAAGGAFLQTDRISDCEYCEYRRICRDVAAATEAAGRKLDEADSPALDPFRALRRV